MMERKRLVFEHCNDLISKRIANIEAILNQLEESRNNESKSSAGDKYETGRAMMHLEEEKNKTQLAEAFQALQLLQKIDPDRKNDTVTLGSLVVTTQGTYFISVGVGKVKVSEQVIYGISLDAPIGQALKNKQTGDSLTFGERHITIQAVY